MLRLLVGTLWGDEGKGKMADFFAPDVGIRFAGGGNAAHTVYRDGRKHILRLAPTSLLRGRPAWLGAGMVIDCDALREEIRGLDASRLRVDPRVHLVMPYHREMERRQEDLRGHDALDPTFSGIGPAYADKAARTGLRLADILAGDVRDALRYHAREKAPLAVDVEALADACARWADALRPLAAPIRPLLQEALRQGQNVLLEGAQGLLLDLDWGTYPYVTSSHPTVAGALASLGLGPRAVDEIVGVVKCYATRMGRGPLPSEIPAREEPPLRRKWKDYRSRLGWLDAFAARHALALQGADAVALTRLDSLSGLASIPVCTGWRLGETLLDEPPATGLERVEPVWTELEGWSEPLGEACRLSDLPPAARRFVDFLQGFWDRPIRWLSVGPRAEQTIVAGQ